MTISSGLNWNDTRCIVCMQEADLSIEHIIPRSIGGILTCRFLCKSCNERFGAGFEADARIAPEIRKAAGQHGESISDLRDRLEVGARYKQSFGDNDRTAELRKDRVLGAAKLNDSSLIVPEMEAAQKIRSILGKSGASDREINSAVKTWEAAPPNTEVDLGHGVFIKRWQNHPARPTYDEPALSPLVPLKIAFEFVSLILGGAVYLRNHTLQEVRRILTDQDEASADALIEVGLATASAPFHGIAFQGNRPNAQVQVRLFGTLSFTVEFPDLGIKTAPITYTHDLRTGVDEIRSKARNR